MRTDRHDVTRLSLPEFAVCAILRAWWRGEMRADISWRQSNAIEFTFVYICLFTYVCTYMIHDYLCMLCAYIYIYICVYVCVYIYIYISARTFFQISHAIRSQSLRVYVDVLRNACCADGNAVKSSPLHLTEQRYTRTVLHVALVVCMHLDVIST